MTRPTTTPPIPPLERPARILLTTDTVGGVWTYSVDLAQALGANGLRVELATMGAAVNADQRAAVAALPHVTLHESTFRLEWMEEPWEDVERAGAWLLELEQATRPDIVHLNQFAFGALPWRAPTMVVGHSCVLSWWQAVHGEAAPTAWNRYRTAVTTGLRGAGMVVAPSAAMLHELAEHYGPLPHPRVIYNGRAPQRFTPARKEPLVLSAGRLWDTAKNVALLDAVAGRLSWPVYVAGSETHPDGGRVQFESARPLGMLTPDALAGWLGRASIFALPARYEPFGLSVLEAALAGCALVLGDTPSLRELWRGVAVFVPPDDGELLQAAIETLVQDQPLRHALAMRARRRALSRTPQRSAAAYLEAYAALLHERATLPKAREVIVCAS